MAERENRNKKKARYWAYFIGRNIILGSSGNQTFWTFAPASTSAWVYPYQIAWEIA